MKRSDQYAFYDLGQRLRALSHFNGDQPAASVYLHVYFAQQCVMQLLSGIPINIVLSRHRCDVLLTRLKVISKDILDEKGMFYFTDKEPPPIPSWAFDGYRSALTEFETSFQDEMRSAAAYYVPKIGIFDTQSLIDSADDTFPSELLPWIPEKTRAEWRSAGKCLAFNLLSASNFHVARAVEGTLDRYYEAFVGKPPAKGRSWGHLLSDLENQRLTPNPSNKTLAEIKQLKDDYRNPLMHPRVSLTEADSRMLFSNGESIIIAMAEELKSINIVHGGIQTNLAGMNTATEAHEPTGSR